MRKSLLIVSTHQRQTSWSMSLINWLKYWKGGGTLLHSAKQTCLTKWMSVYNIKEISQEARPTTNTSCQLGRSATRGVWTGRRAYPPLHFPFAAPVSCLDIVCSQRFSSKVFLVTLIAYCWLLNRLHCTIKLY